MQCYLLLCKLMWVLPYARVCDFLAIHQYAMLCECMWVLPYARVCDYLAIHLYAMLCVCYADV